MASPVRPRREPAPPPERVGWRHLREGFAEQFAQGEHICIMGKTGEGKTTAGLDICEALWQRGCSIAVLANKAHDEVLTGLTRKGYRRIRAWPPDYADRVRRKVLVWPTYGRASTTAKKTRPVFTKALDELLHERGWVVYIDEAIYFTETLGMRQIVDEYWNSARSAKVTLVANAQAHTWINKTMIRQETWAVIFRPANGEDLKDQAKIFSVPPDDIETLKHHEFLMVNTRTGQRYISKIGT
jgi:nucleoside-triphosphatase THEP1